MLQPSEHHLFTRFLNFPSKEDLVQYRVNLVKVEDEIQLADIAKESIEDLNEEVNCLEVGKFVVVGVDTSAEKEPGVSAVDDFVVAELDKVGLILLVARRNETVDLALELNLFVVTEGGVPFGQTGFASGKGVSQRMVFF